MLVQFKCVQAVLKGMVPDEARHHQPNIPHDSQ